MLIQLPGWRRIRDSMLVIMPAKNGFRSFVARPEMAGSKFPPNRKVFHRSLDALSASNAGKLGVFGSDSEPGFAAVVDKCANAACSAPFLYLREGKIFRMEFALDRNPRGPALAESPKPVRKIEHFWLCGPCSTTLTLVMNGDRVETAPVDPVAFKTAAAS